MVFFANRRVFGLTFLASMRAHMSVEIVSLELLTCMDIASTSRYAKGVMNGIYTPGMMEHLSGPNYNRMLSFHPNCMLIAPYSTRRNGEASSLVVLRKHTSNYI